MGKRAGAAFVIAAVLATSSQVAAQDDVAETGPAKRTGTDEWLCNVTDPNAPASDFVFEVPMRVVQDDNHVFWTVPPRAGETQSHTTTFTLIENNEYGMVAVRPARHGGTQTGFGIEMLILNKASGGFRGGGSVVGGHYTFAEGSCARK